MTSAADAGLSSAMASYPLNASADAIFSANPAFSGAKRSLILLIYEYGFRKKRRPPATGVIRVLFADCGRTRKANPGSRT